MARCLAIYPGEITSSYIDKIRDYIVLAKRYDFDEIFTSIHLPEHSLSYQLDAFGIIAEQCRNHGLELTADVGGKYIDQMLSDEELLGKLRKIPFAFIRLDYGFDISQVRRLYEELEIKGFVINASIYSQKEVDELIKKLRDINRDIELRACHNFYVREESGLNESFAYRQSSYFDEYDIPVYYCIPSYCNPRGPLHKGLCTIENHRFRGLRDILVDLYVKYDMKAFMLGDEWLDEKQLQVIKRTMEVLREPLSETVKIPVSFLEGANTQERQAVLKKHVFRYDSPADCLRSQSSRQMAEFASEFRKNNTIERKAGSITIDNESYKRYSGEVQVILNDLKEDERVNVVARVADPDDLIRLARFREGREYQFIEV